MARHSVLQKAPSLRKIPCPTVQVGKGHEPPAVRVCVGPVEFPEFPDMGVQVVFHQVILGDTGIGRRKMGIRLPGFGSPEDSRRFLKVSTNRRSRLRGEMPEWKGFPP